MSDNMTATPEQKKELAAEALKIAGFTENSEYPGVFTQELGMKKIVKDLNTGGKSYFLVDKKKVTDDDEHKTLEKVDNIITEAEDGRMPSRSEPSEVVNTGAKEGTPEQPDGAQTVADSAWNGGTKDAPEHKKYAQTQPDNNPPENERVDYENMATSNDLLGLIQKYVGNDVMQVFGDTGTGKSKFALEVAREAIAAGKKVYYLDTERNLTTEDIDSLEGCEYKYTPVLDEIDKIVQKLPAVDVVILDSIGFPVLTSYARLSMKQKGDALLKLIAIFGDLKIWAYRNNGVAVVTNQPESEFNKEKGHIFRPFGDKSQFACKEIWKTEFEHRSPNETRVSIKSFRSRSMGQRSKIASLKITDTGVEVIT